MNDRKELLRKAHHLKPVVRVGKEGVTPALVTEVTKHLKKRKLIKVKFLKSCTEHMSIHEYADIFAKECNAKVVQVKGFVVTYAVQGLSVDGRQ